MTVTRTISTGLLAAAMALAIAPAALSKGHDKGVADGSPNPDPSFIRGGLLASPKVPGISTDPDNFLGIVDANHDMTFGQDVVRGLAQSGQRRIRPCGVGSLDACTE